MSTREDLERYAQICAELAAGEMVPVHVPSLARIFAANIREVHSEAYREGSPSHKPARHPPAINRLSTVVSRLCAADSNCKSLNYRKHQLLRWRALTLSLAGVSIDPNECQKKRKPGLVRTRASLFLAAEDGGRETVAGWRNGNVREWHSPGSRWISP